jgi:hypothetical protein
MCFCALARAACVSSKSGRSTLKPQFGQQGVEDGIVVKVPGPATVMVAMAMLPRLLCADFLGSLCFRRVEKFRTILVDGFFVRCGDNHLDV